MSQLVLLKQISYVPASGMKQISYVHYYTVVVSKRYVAFCGSSKMLNCLPVLGRCYSGGCQGITVEHRSVKSTEFGLLFKVFGIPKQAHTYT
jgi:hypothetical protein